MLGGTKTFSSFSAKDIAAEKRFYGDTLGLELSEENGLLRVNLPDGGEVIVYPKADHQPASFTVLNFQVDDLEREVDDLRSKGVTFERYDSPEMQADAKGIVRNEYGPPITWFTDPAGNILSVMEEPAAS
jgi:catechol 2,3-dioxygenase-like lactoylglutathione lyase family enzyme